MNRTQAFADMHPLLAKRIKLWEVVASDKGLSVIYTSVKRMAQEQYALWLQGRDSLEHINMARNIAGMPYLSAFDKLGKIIIYKPVTWTLDSRHVVNLNDSRKDNDVSTAVDFAIVYGKGITYDLKININKNQLPDYEELAELALTFDLEPGFYFKDKKGRPNPDPCHLQLYRKDYV